MRQLLHLIIYIALLAAALVCCTTEAERNRMRSGLDSINVRNRTDQPFTPQDVQPYVKFFDSHGDANDRLLAHYLLGRAYHEKGDAPMALECYQHAIDCADTTATDCDYKQLCRVYAQMAEIFYQQGLYREQINHILPSVTNAWKGKDTLAAIINYEQLSDAYMKTGQLDSAIYVAEQTIGLFLRFGYKADAAISSGNIIPAIINLGDYMKARRLMHYYEQESGLFNSDGNIQSGREVYYYIKGLLFLKVHQLDSAEYWFRKEFRDGKDFNNQNGAAYGLASVFSLEGKSDSVAKYAMYAYAMNDSVYAYKTTNTIKRMQSMYDYSNYKEKEIVALKKAEDRRLIIRGTVIVVLLLILVLCLCVAAILHLRYRRKKAEQKYERSIEIVRQARNDLAKLELYKQQNHELIAEKKKLIDNQESIRKALLQNENASQNVAQRQFKSTTIYERFQKYADNGKHPSKNDWQDLQDAIFYAYPNFSELMSRHSQLLNDTEYKTCILVRAGFAPGVISNMTGVHSSGVTQLRALLCKKVFGLSGSSKEFDIRLCKIY